MASKTYHPGLKRMVRTKWGVRTNGLRLSGDLFNTWHDAKEAMWERANSLLVAAQRAEAQNPDSFAGVHADEMGRLVAVLLSEMIDGAKMTPRPNLRIRLPDYRRAGLYNSFEITREPF